MWKCWTGDLLSLQIKYPLYLDTLRCCWCRIVSTLVSDSSFEAFAHKNLSCLRESDGRLAWSRILWTYWRCSRLRYLILHVYIWFTMLYWIYLGHSGNTGLIPNLQFETKSGMKYWKTVYKGNIIIDSLEGISHWESWIGLTFTNLYSLVCNTCK